MVESSDMRVLAMISEAEFEEFVLYLPDLRAWPSYDDFVMERDGYFIGSSWAGENVVQVEVPLRLFRCWVDLTGSSCSMESLDDFAKRRWLRARYPEWNMQLVRPEATSRVADRSGPLYIPVCLTAVEAWQRRILRVPAGSASTGGRDLARVIAEECLDPAD
jgi:hypothetical protein